MTFIYFICECVVCICVGMCVMEEVWRSEDSLGKLNLFYDNQTQIARFGSKTLYQLSHLYSPQSLFKGWFVRRIRPLGRKKVERGLK